MTQDWYQCDEETYNSSLDPNEDVQSEAADSAPVHAYSCSVCRERIVLAEDDEQALRERFPCAPCGCPWASLQCVDEESGVVLAAQEAIEALERPGDGPEVGIVADPAEALKVAEWVMWKRKELKEGK